MSDETILQHGPRRIGKYLVEGVLGEGAMGVVYRARDPDIDRPVAVKVIREAGLGPAMREEFDSRFRREAMAAGRLNHPGIVAVYDFGRDGGLSYLAMEYVEGRSLAAALREDGEWPVDRIVAVTAAILDALGHAHAQGVVHRDVKPDNVLLPAAGGVKLTDFGIARLEEAALTQSGTVLGTPYYMAPEQVQGRKVSSPTDLYAVGVMLYEMLAGERPFTGTTTSLTQKILHQTPVRPSLLNVGVPAWLDDVVAKAMAKTPADRYQTADAFAAALRAPEAATSPRGATDDAAATRATPGKRRRGGRWPAIAAAALLALAGLGYGTWLAVGGPEDDAPAQDVATPSQPPSVPPAPEMPQQRGNGTGIDDSPIEETAVDETAVDETAVDEPGDDETAVDEPGDDEIGNDEIGNDEIGNDEIGNDESPAEESVAQESAADAGAREDAQSLAWAEARRQDTAEAYADYLDAHPEGPQADAAARRIADLEAAAPRAAFDRALAEGTPEALRRALADAPTEALAAEAERRLAALDDQAWSEAAARDTSGAYFGYLEAYPDGAHAEAAAQRIAELEAEAARAELAAAMAIGTPRALRQFAENAPNEEVRAEAEARLAALERAAWAGARQAESRRALELYLEDFPDGARADAARDRLAELARAAEAAPGPAADADAVPERGEAEPAREADAPPSGGREDAEAAGADSAADRETAALPAAEPAPAPTPAEIEAALGLSRGQRAQIQRALGAAGQPVGPPDGLFGPRTRSAIVGWQRDTGAATTGYLTPRQAAALQQAAANLPPPPPPEPAEPAAPPQAAATPRPPPAESAAEPAEPPGRDEACVERAAGPATLDLNLRRVETNGSRGIARRQCNAQVDIQLNECLAAGGSIQPYNPVCQCDRAGGNVYDCVFDPRGRIPPFTCELPETAAASVDCP